MIEAKPLDSALRKQLERCSSLDCNCLRDKSGDLYAALLHAEAQIAELKAAIEWCVNDGAYKAPEEWNVHMNRWDCKLRAALNAARAAEAKP